MKILIIEDESPIRNVLRLSLEAECFSIDEAEDGEKGSYMARTNEYDAIILDNVMPKKFGMQVCKEIREAGVNTPILMLSVKSNITDKVTVLQNGADDYVTKPFSFEELLTRLRCLLRRPPQVKDDILRSGNLILDRNKHKTLLKEKEIYLTRKEFAILELMMLYSDKVVSRGQILEHAWDINANPFSNTIEAHIFSLRKKIRDKRKGIIKNIPGRGYILNTAVL